MSAPELLIVWRRVAFCASCDLACHLNDVSSSRAHDPSVIEFPQPFISSDPGAWMRPIYADVARRPGFATWSTQHQFNALVDAIAAEYPQEAAKMRDDGPITQRAILGLLADMTRRKVPARQVELWTVRKGEDELRALAVYLPSGIDLRLVEQDEFRRTALCRDAPELHARARAWKTKLLDIGWREATKPPEP